MSPAAAITGSPLGVGVGVGVGVAVGAGVAVEVGVGVGDAMLDTPTLIAGDVPQFPAASAALATIVCWPSAAVDEVQLACHGAAPSHPTSVPSTYHFTCVTPTPSEAPAASATVPETSPQLTGTSPRPS